MVSNKLNLKEIIEMAIQIETTGAAFYSKMAETAESDETRKLFKDLEKAEHQHIKDFEAVLAAALDKPGKHAYQATEVDLLYLRAFASRRIFTSPEDAVNKAENLGSILEAIDMALDFELSSVGFYKEMADLIESPEDRQSVLDLERQEKEHAAHLYRMRERITGSSQ